MQLAIRQSKSIDSFPYPRVLFPPSQSLITPTVASFDPKPEEERHLPSLTLSHPVAGGVWPYGK
jgi:hypothetical protein